MENTGWLPQYDQQDIPVFDFDYTQESSYLSPPDFYQATLPPEALAFGLNGIAPSSFGAHGAISSSESSGDRELPTKKARSAYATSCAACRMRKTRCIREDDRPCASCVKRGINCVEVGSAEAPAPTRRKYKQRTGQRIEKAKAAFGHVDLQPESGSALVMSPASTPSNLPNLSLSSVATQMDNTQISAAFAAALVDTYYSSNYFPQPCISWSDLRHRLSSVGYRPSELSPSTQSLLSVIIATASRVALHEGIIGPSSMTNLAVLPLRPEVDLAMFGERRDRICIVLLQEARKKMAQDDLLVTPSPESVASLYLLYCLMNLTEEAGGSAGRQYAALAGSHLRALHEEEKDSSVQNQVYSDHVNFTICISDCMTSSNSGRALQLTDDDVEIFLSKRIKKGEMPSMQIIDEVIANPTGFRAGRTTQALWCTFINNTRTLVSTVTGPIARKRPFDSQAVLNYWAAHDALVDFTSEARVVIRQVVSASPWFYILSTHLETGRVCSLVVLMSCHDALKRRKATQVQSMEEDDLVSSMLMMSTRRMQEAAIQLADHLEALTTASSSLTLATTVNMVQVRLDDWMTFLKDAPTHLMGGPSEFTLQRKIQLVDACVTTYKALGWSWPGLGAKATALAQFRDQLRADLVYQQMFELHE